MSDQPTPPAFLRELADACGGELKEVSGPLPDGSGFALMSMPLPKTHWIYKGDRTESYGVFNTPPMPFQMGREDQAIFACKREGAPMPDIMSREVVAEKIRRAGRYAIRASTMNGSDMDFDPDAMLQNLVVGMLGYWTETGLSSDEWANPKEGE